MHLGMSFQSITGDSIVCCNNKDADEQHAIQQHQFGEPVLLQRNEEEMFAAEEDEHGTYFMNSKDLRAVQHVDRLTRWASIL
jgi:putative protease